MINFHSTYDHIVHAPGWKLKVGVPRQLIIFFRNRYLGLKKNLHNKIEQYFLLTTLHFSQKLQKRTWNHYAVGTWGNRLKICVHNAGTATCVRCAKSIEFYFNLLIMKWTFIFWCSFSVPRRTDLSGASKTW